MAEVPPPSGFGTDGAVEDQGYAPFVSVRRMPPPPDGFVEKQNYINNPIVLSAKRPTVHGVTPARMTSRMILS